MDELPFGIIFLDDNLSVVAINEFLRQRLAQADEILEGANVETLLGERPEQTLSAFLQALESGQPTTLSARFHKAVFRLQSPPGAPPMPDLPHVVTVLPINVEEKVDGLAVIVQDISDRVLAERELMREIEKLTFLHQLDLALSTLSLDECMRTLVAGLMKIFNADFAALLASQGSKLEAVASLGLPLPDHTRYIDPSKGLTGWVFRNARPVRIADVRRDPRYLELFESIRSEMAAPLIANGQCIGVIDLESNTPAAFSAADLRLLEMVAFSAANALNNAQTHVQVEKWRAYYQAVLNQTSDVIYTVDSTLRLTSVNAAWDDFARQNDGQSWLSPTCLGKNLLSALRGMQQEKWRAICAELLNGGRQDYRENIPCHSPERERWLALRAAPLKNANGQIDGIIFNTHDISEHVLAERALRAANQQLQTMLRVSQLLNQNIPNANIPQLTVETLVEVMRADCVSITYLNDGEKAFRVLAAYGASDYHRQNFASPVDKAHEIIGRHGNTGVIYHLAERMSLPNYLVYQHDQLQGLLYSLIEHQGEVIGSLNIFTRDPQRRFSAEEMDLVRGLTPMIALAMVNARMYERIQYQASTDGLTGLANRRQLDDLLARETERSKRYQRIFSLLMIDLDHYKCYNDTYGHEMGDALLKDVASLLRSKLRAGDIPCRYGGDEFLVILPEVDKPGALNIAQRLRREVSAHFTPTEGDPNCDRLTLSIGVATFPEDADNPTELLRCADQALYRAKQMGRDRVEVFISQPPVE